MRKVQEDGLDASRKKKYLQLQALLRSYGRVAVAFSGGADSSLLLKAALDTLDRRDVLALFAQSSVLKVQEIERARRWLENNGYVQGIDLEILQWHPLAWKGFAENGTERCYICKLRMYKEFFERMAHRHFAVLVDGTNSDDLKTHRPGLRAMHELGVQAPFVEVGIDKADIRFLGEWMGLSNWHDPSSSCLATRIPTGIPLTRQWLLYIEQWEEELARFGLSSCRVRLEDAAGQVVSIAVDTREFAVVLDGAVRAAIVRLLKKSGVNRVFLDLEGR